MTEIFLNPYVIQMDKFADSLIHLSRTFLSLESYKGTFSKEEFEEMFARITDQVCGECEKRNRCLKENRVYTYQLMYEILCGVEEYGAELSTELKRKLQKRCIRAPRFLRETLEVFESAKQVLLWNHKIAESREGYAGPAEQLCQIDPVYHPGAGRRYLRGWASGEEAEEPLKKSRDQACFPLSFL